MEVRLGVTLLLLLYLLAIPTRVAAFSSVGTGVALESLSNKANEFYTGFFANDDNVQDESVFLLVTTDEPVPVQFTVNITVPEFFVTGTVRHGTVTSIELPNDVKVGSRAISDRYKSVHVKAQPGRRISVYGSNYATSSADVFTALPCLESSVNAQGYRRQRYHVFSSQTKNTVSRSLVLIIGCQDNTNVIISPTSTVDLPNDVNPTQVQLGNGDIGNLILQKGETLLIESSADLTNTIIRSNKPIVVLSGHQCAQVPIGAEGCDHIVQQIPPHFTWGKVFFTAGLAGRKSGELIRVANANFDTAVVNITCVQEGSQELVRNSSSLGQATTLTFATQPDAFCCIEANQPVLVMMYSQGYSVGSEDKSENIGDPFLLTIPPVDQYSNNFVISTRVTSLLTFENYVNIVVPAEFFDNTLEARTNVRLNGSRAASAENWHPISCYSGETCAWATRVRLQVGTADIFHQNSQAGMAAFVYGIAAQTSYGYVAGYSLDPVSLPIITLMTTDLTVPENISIVSIEVARHGDTSEITVVDFTVIGEDATAGVDFAPANQTLTFLPGETKKLVHLTIFDGPEPEDAERLVISISTTDPAVAFSRKEATLTITDDDKFVVGFERGSYTVDEADGFLELIIESSIDYAGQTPLQLRFFTDDGTATSNIDFIPQDLTINFGDSEETRRRRTVTVEILDDEVVEGVNETFTVRLEAVNAEDVTLIGLDKATVTVVDINVVQIFLSPTFVEVSEDSGEVVITVEKRGATEQTTNIFLNALSTMATADEDYAALPNLVLQFLPNETHINVTVEIINDAVLESDEMLSVEATVAEEETSVVLQQPTSTILIQDEDYIDTHFERDTYTVSEGSGSITVLIFKRGANSIPVSVSVGSDGPDATAPHDFLSLSEDIVFPPSNADANHSVSVQLQDDAVVENPERFILILSSNQERGVNISDPTAEVIITDDDAVEIGFTQMNYSVVENEASVQLQLQKVGENAVDVSVELSTLDGTAKASEDYTEVLSHEVTFAPDDTELTVNVSLVNNNLTEEIEVFSAELLSFGSKVVLANGRDTTSIEILDDDVVEVNFVLTSYTFGESEDEVTLMIAKRGVTTNPLSVNISAEDGTALDGDDFVRTIPDTIIFGKDETTLPVTFRVFDDNVVEAVEEFRVRVHVTDDEMGARVGNNDTATVSILDNDFAVVGFEPVDLPPVAEGAGVGFRIVKQGQTAVDVIVQFSTTDLEAVAPGDYDMTVTNLTFAPSDLDSDEQLVPVETQDDEIWESVEQFRAVISSVSPWVTISNGEAFASIDTDVDDAVVVGFDRLVVAVSEMDRMVVLTLVKHGDNEAPVYITVSTMDGSAQAEKDYLAEVVEVEFLPLDTIQHINISLVVDKVLENTETFTVQLTADQGAVIDALNGSATVNISDSTIGVPIGFNPVEFEVDEQDAAAIFQVELFGVLERTLSVLFTTANRTATAGEDYNHTAMLVTFAPGETTQTVPVTLIDDDILEGEETFGGELTNLDGGVTFVNGSATATIAENDRVVIEFASPEYTVEEGENEVVLTVVKIGIAIRNVSVTFTTVDETASGSILLPQQQVDYTPVIKTLIFQPQDTVENVSISIVDNGVVEEPEVFIAILGILPGDDGVAPGQEMTRVTIVDDDVVNVGFTQAEFRAFEGEPTVTLVVSKTGENGFNLVINVITEDGTATAPDDYFTTNTTVEFERNDLTRVVTVAIGDDEVYEGDEVFTVRLFVSASAVRDRVSLSSGTATVRIIDDDVVDISFDKAVYEAKESSGFVVLSLIRAGTALIPVSVSVVPSGINATAIDGEDYILGNQTILFQPNETTRNVTIELIRDGVVEMTEEFGVQLIPGEGALVAQGHAIVRIVDGPPPLVICKVEDSILINPFHELSTLGMNYNFHAACEHILVSTCDTNTLDFTITADFVASDLDMGRVGVRLGNQTIVIDEQLNVTVDNFGDPESDNGVISVYEGNITVIQEPPRIAIIIPELGIEITRVKDGGNESALFINVTSDDTPIEVCGLCGTLSGTLLYSDRNTAASYMNSMEVEIFADSWRVNPSEQFLREQERECGFLSDDVIIGDPLFTVPLYDKNDTTPPNIKDPLLCFEIHGAANHVFNLVSDQCTSVNALYSPMNISDNGNIISAVGVKAVNNLGQCVEITVRLEDDCIPVISDTGGTSTSSRYGSSGISVRTYGKRVRISVPNCENTKLSMWVTCDDYGGQEMIKFQISRGVNLRSTSHGLLGQFWNVPVTFELYNYTGSEQHILSSFSKENLYIVTVDPPIGAPRSFIAELYHRTWERAGSPCYYAGTSQGGPLNEFNLPSDPVIQGQYKQYRVSSLHDTGYVYSQFNGGLCN